MSDVDCRCDTGDYYADPCQADDCSVAFAQEFGGAGSHYTPPEPKPPVPSPEVPDCDCWQTQRIDSSAYEHRFDCEWIHRMRRDCGRCEPWVPCEKHNREWS